MSNLSRGFHNIFPAQPLFPLLPYHSLSLAEYTAPPSNPLTASLCHCTFPGTSAISFSVSPNFTTPHLIMRGSTAVVLCTSRCVAAEESKRMMKWWPLSCRTCERTLRRVRRKGPQFVMPRTTPPLFITREPAVRAILGGERRGIRERERKERKREKGGALEMELLLFDFGEVSDSDLKRRTESVKRK